MVEGNDFEGNDSETTGSVVGPVGSSGGLGSGAGVYCQRLPAVEQARLRGGVRVRLWRLRIGAAAAVAGRPAGRIDGNLALGAFADPPVQLARLRGVISGSAGSA